ncbi:13341_t:CDS:2, partial [Cetraspora pellucida]
FHQQFPNWTSGDQNIDKFIHDAQLSAAMSEHLGAIWIDGIISEWNHEYNDWSRIQCEIFDDWTYHFDGKNKILMKGRIVTLKSLQNSSNVNECFLNEWKRHLQSLKSARKIAISIKKICKWEWKRRLKIQHHIISGLIGIHQSDLVHKDLHTPVNSYVSNRKELYGVLPYMAPEVLRGNPYTKAADIYSFGMLMWKITSEEPPFN